MMRKSSDLRKYISERKKHDMQFGEGYEEGKRRLQKGVVSSKILNENKTSKAKTIGTDTTLFNKTGGGVSNKFTTEVNAFIEKYRSALKRLSKK